MDELWGNYRTVKSLESKSIFLKKGQLSRYLHESGAQNSLNLWFGNLKLEFQIFIKTIPNHYICKFICLSSYKTVEIVQSLVRFHWLKNAENKPQLHFGSAQIGIKAGTS